jgi:flagellar hook assembly protein FlgD
MATESFDWDGGDRVVDGQLAIAVYKNSYGEVVIRQEAGATDSEDHFVIISPTNLSVVISSLQKMMEG